MQQGLRQIPQIDTYNHLLSQTFIYHYNFNTKFLVFFIDNLIFYNNTNNLYSQYKPIMEDSFIKITKAKHRADQINLLGVLSYILLNTVNSKYYCNNVFQKSSVDVLKIRFQKTFFTSSLINKKTYPHDIITNYKILISPVLPDILLFLQLQLLKRLSTQMLLLKILILVTY